MSDWEHNRLPTESGYYWVQGRNGAEHLEYLCPSVNENGYFLTWAYWNGDDPEAWTLDRSYDDLVWRKCGKEEYLGEGRPEMEWEPHGEFRRLTQED